MPAERNSLAANLRGLQGYAADALPVAVAREALRRLIRPIADCESIALAAASGRVLAGELTAPANVPGYDNAAMDGFAVRALDLRDDATTELAYVGTVLAGQRAASPLLLPGECVRIMTGAALPPGADTVVMQEHAEVVGARGDKEARVRIPARQKTGQHVRRAGEDIRAGQVLLAAGHRLRPADLGLIASLGLGTLEVRRRLRVAFFSTGDEVASIGEPLGPGHIYDSNRYTLHAMLLRLGFEAIDLGVVRDDPAALERALLEAAARADAIVTSGGVSGGDADYVRGLAQKLGEVLFWKLAMRPGRPLAFGRIGRAWLFALPGNPVATMVAFCVLVREALLRIAGCGTEHDQPALNVRCTTPLRKVRGRTEYQRGILLREASGDWCVRSTGDQGSGILRSMSLANCLIVLDEVRGDVAAGESVPVQPFARSVTVSV